MKLILVLYYVIHTNYKWRHKYKAVTSNCKVKKTWCFSW
jgi:hypothetical protein